MKADEFASQIEYDLRGRLDELRFFKETREKLNGEEAEKYNQCLVLILYAHYEGFCKFAAVHYLTALTRIAIPTRDARPELAALSGSPIFDVLTSGKHHPDFARKLPDDRTLHRVYRQTEFWEKIGIFGDKQLHFDPEKTVDTQSNLWPHVLKRILYTSGMDYTGIVPFEEEINKLLALRNKIAHGDFAGGKGIRLDLYEGLETAIVSLLHSLRDSYTRAFAQQMYLKVRR